MTEDQDTGKALSSALLLVGIVALGLLTRTLLMIGRGQLIDFDENFYLILGKNLFAGRGYLLDMYPDIKFPPLFPVAANLVAMVVGNLVWSGRIVTILTGGLTCVPFYFLVKELKNTRLALVGALFVSLLPQFQDFIMRSAWFRDFLYTGAEPVAYFFLMSGVALIVCGVRRKRILLAALAGVAFGIAYQGRPECFIYGLVYCVGIVALGVVVDRASLKHRVVCAALCVVMMILSAMPYLVYLRKQAGVWTLSGKILIPEESVRGVEKLFDENDWTEQLKYTYELSPDNKHLESTHWGMSDYHRKKHTESDEVKWHPSAGRMLGNARRFFISVFWHLCPIYLWPFFVGGVVLSLRTAFKSRKDFENEMLLLALIVPSLGLVVRYRILPRYLLPICFLVIYYSSVMVAFIGRKMLDAYGDRPRRILVGTLSFLLGIQTLWPVIAPNQLALGYLRYHVDVGRVAEALGQSTDEGMSIMCFHPQPVFRADRIWRTMPVVGQAKRIFEYALHTNTDAILFGPEETYPIPSFAYPYSDRGFKWVLFDLRPLREGGASLDTGQFVPGKSMVMDLPSGRIKFFLEVKAVPPKEPQPAEKRKPG